MANGKRLDDNAYTCASWDYPVGDVLCVSGLDSGRGVLVMVTDRGPSRRLYRKGRIIDLSKAAFLKLAPLEQGVIKVRVSKLGN